MSKNPTFFNRLENTATCLLAMMAFQVGSLIRKIQKGSRELTYPTWGKGKSSLKVPFGGIG